MKSAKTRAKDYPHPSTAPRLHVSHQALARNFGTHLQATQSCFNAEDKPSTHLISAAAPPTTSPPTFLPSPKPPSKTAPPSLFPTHPPTHRLPPRSLAPPKPTTFTPPLAFTSPTPMQLAPSKLLLEPRPLLRVVEHARSLLRLIVLYGSTVLSSTHGGPCIHVLRRDRRSWQGGRCDYGCGHGCYLGRDRADEELSIVCACAGSDLASLVLPRRSVFLPSTLLPSWAGSRALRAGKVVLGHAMLFNSIAVHVLSSLHAVDPPLRSWARRARAGAYGVRSQSGDVRLWIVLECASFLFCLLLFWGLSRGVSGDSVGGRGTGDSRWLICVGSSRDLKGVKAFVM